MNSAPPKVFVSLTEDMGKDHREAAENGVRAGKGVVTGCCPGDPCCDEEVRQRLVGVERASHLLGILGNSTNEIHERLYGYARERQRSIHVCIPAGKGPDIVLRQSAAMRLAGSTDPGWKPATFTDPQSLAAKVKRWCSGGVRQTAAHASKTPEPRITPEDAWNFLYKGYREAVDTTLNHLAPTSTDRAAAFLVERPLRAGRDRIVDHLVDHIAAYYPEVPPRVIKNSDWERKDLDTLMLDLLGRMIGQEKPFEDKTALMNGLLKVLEYREVFVVVSLDASQVLPLVNDFWVPMRNALRRTPHRLLLLVVAYAEDFPGVRAWDCVQVAGATFNPCKLVELPHPGTCQIDNLAVWLGKQKQYDPQRTERALSKTRGDPEELYRELVEW